MNFSKWTNIIKVLLLRLIDELERRINEKQGVDSSDSFKTSLYSSVKFLMLEQIDDLAGEVTGYARKQIHDLATTIVQKLAHVLSSLVYVLIMVILLIIVFLFLTIALSIYLGELLGHPYYGFLISAAIFGILTLILSKWGQITISEKIKAFINKQI
ncbi:MAG: phage holin family protein [Chitinophagales bacterium]|nr:phage holin family protein [Chitinophagales bacterium]